MIDEDDVTAVALFGPESIPWWALGAFLLVMVVAMLVDRDKCSEYECPLGSHPVIIRHECVCLARASEAP